MCIRNVRVINVDSADQYDRHIRERLAGGRFSCPLCEEHEDSDPKPHDDVISDTTLTSGL